MSTDHRRVIVHSAPTELTAAMLVSRLAGAGIEAWVEGGASSGYRAEAPGNANVLVRPADLRRARAELASVSAAAAGPADRDGQVRRVHAAWWVITAWILLLLVFLGAISLIG